MFRLRSWTPTAFGGLTGHHLMLMARFWKIHGLTDHLQRRRRMMRHLYNLQNQRHQRSVWHQRLRLLLVMATHLCAARTLIATTSD